MNNLPRNRRRQKKVSKVPLIILMAVMVAVLYMFVSFVSSEQKKDAAYSARYESTESSTESAILANTGPDSEKDSEAADEAGSEKDSETADEAGSEKDPEAADESDSEPLTFSFVEPTQSETDSPDDNSNKANSSEPTEKEFKVYFVNVGEGDSSLIICDGHAMLIDGGPGSQSDKIHSFLETRNLTHLDYIVATHPDEDHIGGLVGALNYATVDKAFSSVVSDDSESYIAFTKALVNQGVAITIPSAGDVFSLGSASVTVLGPVNPGKDANNNSLIIRVVHGKNSFLFTGDAEEAEQKDLIKSGDEIKSTVLLAGNHGSSASNSSEWLKAVNPSVAVISCGEGNKDGHPAADVLDRLKKSDVKLYRTDMQGFLKVNEEEDGSLSYRVQRNSREDMFVPGTAP